MSSETFDAVVVGAGISGITTAAWYRQAGMRVTVLEASTRAGGILRSERFDLDGGFWTELGAHTGLNSYGHLLDTLSDYQLLDRLVPKTRLPYRMFSAGRRRSVPSCLHWFELLTHLPRLLFTGKEGKAVSDYYGAVAGPRNFRDVLSPAFAAVICQPAGSFPADALFRKKERRKAVVRSFTTEHGMEGIPAAIIASAGVDIRCSQPVAEVSATGAGFELRTEQGDEFDCRELVIATDVAAARRLLTPVAPEAAAILGEIGLSRVESLAVVIRRDATPVPPIAGLIAVDDAFYSMVSRDYLPDSRYRGFTFHFRPGQLDDAGKLRRVAEVLELNPAQIAASARVDNCLPALSVGQEERVRRLDAALERLPVGLTGNYFLGVSIGDCVERSRSEFERLRRRK